MRLPPLAPFSLPRYTLDILTSSAFVHTLFWIGVLAVAVGVPLFVRRRRQRQRERVRAVLEMFKRSRGGRDFKPVVDGDQQPTTNELLWG